MGKGDADAGVRGEEGVNDDSRKKALGGLEEYTMGGREEDCIHYSWILAGTGVSSNNIGRQEFFWQEFSVVTRRLI